MDAKLCGCGSSDGNGAIDIFSILCVSSAYDRAVWESPATLLSATLPESQTVDSIVIFYSPRKTYFIHAAAIPGLFFCLLPFFFSCPTWGGPFSLSI